MAVIALGLSSAATCPSTSPLPQAQALTRCSAALPSRARVPPGRCPSVSGTTAPTQVRKQRWNAAGSSRAKTRPKVSWLGIPSGRARKVRSQATFARPNVATATRPSAPQSTAHTAMAIISTNRGAWPRSARGSCKDAKCSSILVCCPSTIARPRACLPPRHRRQYRRRGDGALPRTATCNCPAPSIREDDPQQASL